MLKLQDMTATPEQHFEIDPRLGLRHHRPRPDEGRQRQEGRDRAEKGAQLQGSPQAIARREGDQCAQHGQAEARAAQPQRRVEHLLIQHRNVVVEHRFGARQEGRHRHHRRACGRQDKAAPAQPRRAVTAQRAPDHGSKRHEPDRHREIHVDHQRGAEQVFQRKYVLDARRAR